MKKIKEFWNKGKWQKVFVVFVCLIVLSGISSALTGEETTSTPQQEEKQETKEESTNQETTETPVQEEQKEAEPQLTVGQKNALQRAKDYLEYSSFSKQGLFDQLKYEGYEDADCQFAVDNCGADWFVQAEKKAQDYMEYSSFSRQGLIDQLVFEGFSQEEAEHGAAAVGY